MDFAKSDDPAVQQQLDRLAQLSLPQGRLGLETIRALLARLGDPQKRLPPVFHVGGTNGKGSTCAFLRAMMEAEGLTIHAATKPHLVRYNERLRIAGHLIDDAMLADLLREVLDAAGDLAPSFFEVTTAATFLAFARVPADACIIEVGLGGRFDATNVLDQPAACAIAALGIDHEQFLLAPEKGVPTQPLARIAFEKAGIAHAGSPLVTQSYPPGPALEIERAALAADAPLFMRGRDWSAHIGQMIEYRDQHGALRLPLPALPGAHQADNAALAVAMIRSQDQITVSPTSMAQGIRAAQWPARLQKLARGPLTDQAAGNHPIWLDGGHNRDAGAAIARHFSGQKLHLIIGMLEGKDPQAIIAPLAPNIISLTAVPISGSKHHQAEDFGKTARHAPDIASALSRLPNDGAAVLIAGSLYLAGEVLKLNEQVPD